MNSAPSLTLLEKIGSAKERIACSLAKAQRPAVMASFGKDSMVLLTLVRETARRTVWSPQNGFPVPVIFLRDPWMQHKNAFADSIARDWGITLHDWAPAAAGVQVKPDSLELGGRYSIGNGVYMDMAKVTVGPDDPDFKSAAITHPPSASATSGQVLNVGKSEDNPGKDFLCGLRDVLERPRVEVTYFPWDRLLIGHKNADVDLFHGPCPLKADTAKIAPGVDMDFILYDWTNDDVWEFIETHKVPYQTDRYAERGLLNDKWNNNDWLHACTRCIDPRQRAPEVFCPKLQAMVPNVGSRVFQLQGLPAYIDKEAAAA